MFLNVYGVYIHAQEGILYRGLHMEKACSICRRGYCVPELFLLYNLCFAGRLERVITFAWRVGDGGDIGKGVEGARKE